MKYHFLFPLSPLLLTIKQFKINKQWYWWLSSVSTKSIEDNQRYLTNMNEAPQRLIKLICVLIRFQGVCSNIWTLSRFLLSKIYNLWSIKATNLGTFWSLLQTQLRQEVNKPLRRSNTFEPWQTHYCRLKTTDNICWTDLCVILKATQPKQHFTFAIKRDNWRYLKNNCRPWSHDMTYKIPPGKIVYNTNDARTHASYMLSSTIRKTTQHLCTILYAMFPLPNVEATNTN